MALFTLKKQTNRLDEQSINDSYVMYLHNFVDAGYDDWAIEVPENLSIMTYDEFKEYYILDALGRSSEFTESMARDFQYLTLDIWPLSKMETV